MTQIQSAAPEKPDKQSRTKFYLILSFLIPMVLMGIGFLLQKVHPFGDRQILVVDCWHQYYPFFQQLHEKLRHGGSLLFTWDSGLGSNFLPILSYYAASPLNLLAALVPDSLLREAFTVNLLLKIGCAGGFFALFLKGTFRRNDFSLCIFAAICLATTGTSSGWIRWHFCRWWYWEWCSWCGTAYTGSMSLRWGCPCSRISTSACSPASSLCWRIRACVCSISNHGIWLAER